VQGLEGQTSVILRTKEEMTKECVDSALAGIGFTEKELERVLPSTFKPELGRILLEQGSNVIIIAGILMTLIVFLAFRSLIPSIAVIQAAVFDILIAVGLLSLMGFELNLAGVAALLLLIGYSIDTDIMLVSKTTKGSKPFGESVNEAFGTGITMTGTTLAAMGAILTVTLFVRLDTIAQIATVILVGLTVDLATTWLTNLSILRWYSNRSKSTSSRFRFSIFRG
jgi:preprotein translocase subunit SecF